MRNIALVFIFMSFNLFAQNAKHKSHGNVFRKDTLSLNFSEFSSSKNDSVVTVIVKHKNDVIETKSFSKSGNKLEVNFYMEKKGKLLLAITKEIGKDNKSLSSWIVNFQDGKITKMKLESNITNNTFWNEEFIKKYIMELFAKIQAIS